VAVPIPATTRQPHQHSGGALAASEARYRALVSALSSLVWNTAADSQIVDMPEWRALTGQTVDEVRGWGWLNALHPDDRDRSQIAWQTAVDTESTYETEYRIRRWDGEYLWHQARGVAIHDEDGSIREWVGICVDIEDRKRLRESEARFHAITNSIDQMIWSTLPDDYHDFYNQRWYDYTGMPQGSTDGEAWNGMFHRDDQDRAWAAWRHSLATGELYEIEYRLRHRSGQYNGIGIRSSVREKMFNPFFTTKPAGEGTGLGLSLSHDIVVKQHGGAIDVETEPDAFTEFRIILPRNAASISSGGKS